MASVTSTHTSQSYANYYSMSSDQIIVPQTGFGQPSPGPTLTVNNDVIRGKSLKSMSFVLNEFSQIANIDPKLTTYWHKRGEQLRNE